MGTDTAGRAELIEEVRPEALRDASLAFAYAYWNSLRSDQPMAALAKIDAQVLASVPGAFLVLEATGADAFRLRSASSTAPANWNEARALGRGCVERRSPVRARIGEKQWIVLPLGGEEGQRRRAPGRGRGL